MLIKGGHGTGAESVDLLVERDTVAAAGRAAHRDAEHARHRLHAVVGGRGGIGEGLAAARTPRGEAKDYVTGAIAAANRLTIGSGHGPVHHFHRWWEQGEKNIRTSGIRANKEQEDDEHHAQSGRRRGNFGRFGGALHRRARRPGAGAW